MATHSTTAELMSAYSAAYLRANGKSPDLAATQHEGWFRLSGQRVSRKALIEMTERLVNRAAGRGQVTDAEYAEIHRTA